MKSVTQIAVLTTALLLGSASLAGPAATAHPYWVAKLSWSSVSRMCLVTASLLACASSSGVTPCLRIASITWSMPASRIATVRFFSSTS